MTATIHHPPKVRRSFLQQPNFAHEGVRLPCRDEDPELFFPLPGGSVDEARAVCRRCPVEVECGDWAIVRGIDDGVWGGLTPEERKERRRPKVVTG